MRRAEIRIARLRQRLNERARRSSKFRSLFPVWHVRMLRNMYRRRIVKP